MNIENKTPNTCEAKPTTRKTHRRFKPALAIGGLALGLSLTSCVDPSLTYSQGQYSPYSTGYRVSTLPTGYRTESISGRTYYYHNGHYYQPGSNGYSVVEAPRSSRYYDDYSSRRQSYNSDRGDRSTYGRNDQRHDRSQVISRLPGGHRVIQHNGNSYYQSDNQYYRRQGDGYIMVNSPY